jgi:dephospho-CoA kinase
MPAGEKIRELFGEEVIRPDRQLDRKKLGAIVFSIPEKRNRLNSILHPAILKEEERRFEAIKTELKDGIVITDAALMIEVKTYTRFERVVVVHCSRDLQLKRLMLRDGITKEEAEKILQSQMPIDEKKRYAHYLIDNAGDPADTEAEAGRVYRLLQTDLEDKREGKLKRIELPL